MPYDLFDTFVVDMVLYSIAPHTQGAFQDRSSEINLKKLVPMNISKIHTQNKQALSCEIYPYIRSQNKPCENKQLYVVY